MIIGIGIDTININRIENTIKCYGNKFIKRCFTEKEQLKAQNKKHIASYYAKKFAAKEACSKALGVGINIKVSWHDIEISNHPSGQPFCKLTKRALDIARNMLPRGYQPISHLSITDDNINAHAFVIFEGTIITEGKHYAKN